MVNTFQASRFRSPYLWFLALTLLVPSLIKAQGTDLKTLEVKDYAKWESLGFNRAFSKDGNWFIYQIRRNNDENELRLYNAKAGTTSVLKEGSRPAFSPDNRWFGYFIDPSAAERKKSKTPLRGKFRLINLDKADTITVKDVAQFNFSSDGLWLAMKRFPAKGKKSKGADLVIRELASGREFNFGNVSEYRWQPEGGFLALIIDAENQAGNAVQLFRPETGSLQVLDNGETSYSNLTWRKESDDLAVYKKKAHDEYEEPTHHILIWKDLDGRETYSSTFDQKLVASFPKGHRIVENRPLYWSEDGNSIFFFIKTWEKKPEKGKEDEDEETEKIHDLTDEAPALQIWHSKDVQVIPEQEQLAKRKREDQFLSVWHINSSKYVRLGDQQTENIRLQRNTKILLGLDAKPYDFDGMFGRGSNDIYSVDLQTGVKNRLLTKANFIYSIGPNSDYFVYVKNGDYYSYDLNNNNSVNLTNGFDANFVNLDDDHPTPEKRPYGFVAWEKDGRSFFVHSKYDLWQLFVDGEKPRKLTNGKPDQVRYRFVNIDFEDYIDQKERLFLSAFGTKSKWSGYSSVVPGKKVDQLTWQEARVGRLYKAEDADQYVFSSETFSDSPDYFMTSSNFKRPKQISETNPFQKDYHWGKSELIEYTNHKGKRLQGALFYPANYEPGKKYPMITYIYELLSDGIHSYGVPSQRNYYSHSVFTHEGYFVLRPDIVFDPGDPGISSVRTMEAAVKAVVDKGLVDEKRVGLVGHSWGGYQAGYAVTQTDIFAASVAGAGLTNFTSMYGMIAWAFGGAPESEHFEVSQERMQVPPYQDVDGYIRNSSVFNVDKLNTPLLFEVGDNDKNVDWRQGIEYYNAARRAGKQFVLLVYANEGHGLRQDKNSADYQMRILKWFGHYLKGETAAPWIQNGIPYEEQMKQLKQWKK